jgi:hypothetical protein
LQAERNSLKDSPHDGAAPDRTHATALAAFAALWAAAAIFDIGSYHDWRGGRWVVLAGLWVLVRPRSTTAFVALAAAGTLHLLLAPTLIGNHQLFVGMVDATILLAAVVPGLNGRRFKVDPAALYRAVAPTIRLALLALYFFAVFHKLNHDWFDPSYSCGTTFHRAQFASLAALSPVASIWLALGFEILIPVLLAIRRTRHMGILAGALFHFVLSINPLEPFYNFSSMLLAAYVLFADPSWIERIVDRIGPARLQWITRTLAVLLAISTALAYAGAVSPADPFLFIWWPYALVWIGAFVVLAAHDRPSWLAPQRAFRLPHPALALLPILVVVNGVMPYLGLKTELAWAMFSNLRTEGGRSNHLLVPADWQIFDHQRDLVQVTASSNRFLQATADRQQQIPYFELRRDPAASVQYIRDGVEYRFDHIVDDPKNPGPLSSFEAKWLIFRPVSGDHQACAH